MLSDRTLAAFQVYFSVLLINYYKVIGKYGLSSCLSYTWASQVALISGKEPCQYRRCRRRGFNPGVGKIPWRRAQQPTPVFLPGEPHGQRSLASYSPQNCKESDMTEVTQHTHISVFRKSITVIFHKNSQIFRLCVHTKILQHSHTVYPKTFLIKTVLSVIMKVKRVQLGL